jgi:hypothetical protein
MAEEFVRHTTEMREKCADNYSQAYDLSERIRKSMLDRDLSFDVLLLKGRRSHCHCLRSTF